jgi:hypothetical protein
MTISDLKNAYPPLPAEGQARVTRTLASLPDHAPPRRRVRLAMVPALVIVLLAGTAVAFNALFSVKDRIDPRFVSQVTEISDRHSNQWLDLHITDAWSDSKRLTLALTMTHKPGAQEVYVFPMLTARSLGQKLDVDIENGFELMDGEWLPARSENWYGPGNHLIDATIMEDILPPAQGDIEWTLTFHVLRTDWDIQIDQHTAKGSFDRNGISHVDFIKQFEEAYRNQVVLLTYGDTTVEYSAMLPTPRGMDEETWDITPTWERLVRSGAFAEVDRFSRSFVTPHGTEEP